MVYEIPEILIMKALRLLAGRGVRTTFRPPRGRLGATFLSGVLTHESASALHFRNPEP